MDGCTSASHAMDRRRFWPPDSPLMKTVPTGVFAAEVRPNVRIVCCTRSTFSCELSFSLHGVRCACDGVPVAVAMH